MAGPTPTHKQLMFVLEYLIDFNGTQAAIRAGYKPSTAADMACQNLNHPLLKKMIAERMKPREAQLRATAERVLQEIESFSLLDVSRAYGPDGRLLPLAEMPEDVRRAIAGVETEETVRQLADGEAVKVVVRKVKFWDKPRGLEMLGKHLKLFVEVHEHHHEISFTPEERRAKVREILGLATSTAPELPEAPPAE